MATSTYSTIIRPCTGNNEDGCREPSFTAWDNSVSVSDGVATIIRKYNFTLDDSNSSSLMPREVCPAEVFNSSGFPMMGHRLPEDTRYRYYGQGSIEHFRDDSHFWTYAAEYKMLKNSDDDDAESTPPWDKRPTNVSISFPEVVTKFTAAFNSNNNRFYTQSDGTRVTLKPIVNSADDPIEAETQKHYVQLSFTYCLEPKNFDITDFIELINTVNRDTIKVCGLTFLPESALIVSAQPQYHRETSDSTRKREWEWWEINIVIQTDPFRDKFRQSLLDVGNRAKWPILGVSNSGMTYTKGTTLTDYASQIYRWQTFPDSDGQNSIYSKYAIGNKYHLAKAKEIYERRADITNPAAFQFEKFDNCPLKNGVVFVDALLPSSPEYQRYRVLKYQEHKIKSWSSLNMPTRGVDW